MLITCLQRAEARAYERVVITKATAALGLAFLLLPLLSLVSLLGAICRRVRMRCHGHSNCAERACRGSPERMAFDVLCGRGREGRARLRPVWDADLVVDAASEVGVGACIATM